MRRNFLENGYSTEFYTYDYLADKYHVFYRYKIVEQLEYTSKFPYCHTFYNQRVKRYL